MSSLVLSAGIVFIGVVLLGAWGRARQDRRRSLAARLPPGVQASRAASLVPARVFSDRTVIAGPKADRVSVGKAELVLAPGLFLVATHQGRVLEARPDAPAEARVAGPRRLVVEGQHPSRRSQVRVELVLNDAESWAAAINAVAAEG